MRVLFFVLSIAMSAHAETFRICEFSAPPENLPLESFRQMRNNLVAWFAPYHTANDAITSLGHPVTLEGKFSYGLTGKDLEHEIVEIWIDDCSGSYAKIRRAKTNSDGRISWQMPADMINEAGEYKIWMRVVGDNTGVSSTLRILFPDTKVAVFDIDGTLTTREDEIRFEVVSELIGGNFSPPPRDNSVQLTNFLRDRIGYEIVYLSGRPYHLTGLTRTWLARHDFAPGTIILAQSLHDAFPTNNSVGKFKVAEIEKIKSKGLRIGRAYGNATTDIFAYKEANVPSERIFTLGKFSGTEGTVGLGDSFYEHHAKLVSAPNASDE